MATPTYTMRAILESLRDTGGEPAQALDTDGLRALGLPDLTGYSGIRVESLTLDSAADDQAVAITDALAVAIVSKDNAFQLRLAAGETLLANLSAFVLHPANSAAGIISSSVLLSGNGASAAEIEVWIIEL